MNLRAIDVWVIVFSAATSAVALLFGGHQASFAQSHLFHGIAILAALTAARFVPDRGDYWPFLRHGYAVLLFGFFYRDAARYIFIFFDHWFDPALMHAQAAIFGQSPVHYLARFGSPWLLDFWMIGYGFYYLMAPTAILLMLLNRRPDLFRRTVVAAGAAFFVSYTLFFLFPLEGPRYALQNELPPLKGFIFYPFVMWVQNKGSIHGGCMPSSHTAVAWIVTYYSARVNRTAGRILGILTALLTVGCVWGRFHYFTDVLAGLTIFAVTVWAVERYNEDSAAVPAAHPAAEAAELAR
jgi:membrane-associated phospholipid phosphatase